jgi:hypothetical protein
MAKISTRPADPDEETTIEKLQEILHNATNGVVSAKASGLVQAGNDIPTLLGNIKAVISLLNRTAIQLFHDLAYASHDNMILTVKMAEAMNVLEALCDVTYDEALDHATADLMDAFAATGGADVTANGELGFDASITYSKSDLKPILREAILRYIEQKIK